MPPVVMSRTKGRVVRYREAEARFWSDVGGDLPTEHMLPLAGLGVRVRDLESGTGPPLLFVHGGPNAGTTWAPLVARLSDFRCIVVDRPGCGLSEASPNSGQSVRKLMSSFVADVVDGLGTKPRGLVASSFGSYAVLVHSVTHPARGFPSVHFGCPALAPGARTPLRFLLQSLPGFRSVLLKLEPPTIATAWKAFRQIGHGKSIDRGLIPEAGMEWYAALLADTHTRENDLALFSRIRPKDRLTRDDLASVAAATSFFWGTDDTFGGPPVAEAVAAAIPNASLTLVEDAGHLPWLDDPAAAANHVRAFFGGLTS